MNGRRLSDSSSLQECLKKRQKGKFASPNDQKIKVFQDSVDDKNGWEEKTLGTIRADRPETHKR